MNVEKVLGNFREVLVNFREFQIKLLGNSYQLLKFLENIKNVLVLTVSAEHFRSFGELLEKNLVSLKEFEVNF